jgi:methionine-rich copper-binding protein CopC
MPTVRDQVMARDGHYQGDLFAFSATGTRKVGVRRAKIKPAIVLATVLFCLLISHQSGAATSLSGSIPENASRVAKFPSTIILKFGTGVLPVYVRILDKTGQKIGRVRNIHTDGRLVVGDTDENPGRGKYVVEYFVIAPGPERVGGHVSFEVLGP